MTTSYYNFSAWADDTKASSLTTTAISAVKQVSRDLKCNEPYEYTIDIFLEDTLAASLAKGAYAELNAGKTTPTLIANGRVQSVSKNDDDQGTYQVVLSSPMIDLANINGLGDFEADYPTYRTMMDVLNGPSFVGTTGSLNIPGKHGMLDGTGWYAVWTVPPTGTYNPPGLGDSGRGQWGTALLNMQTLLQIYHLFCREHPPSYPTHGRLDVGPLNDTSGVTIWGGDPLATQLGLPAGSDANAFSAQQAGLIGIEQVTLAQTMAQVKNLIWPTGHGRGRTLVTLRSIFGDVFQSDGVTLAAGVTLWQPNAANNGRKYYVKSNNVQTWQGHTYELVASQQNDGQWAFGVVDRTSVGKYGLVEAQHRYPKATTPDLLLSLGLGQLEIASDPPDQWTFVTRHPFWTTDLPSFVLPGQTIVVHYAGAVHNALTLDANGQPISAGAYTYMTFPATPTLDQQRVVEVQDQFDANGDYTATYTMGKIATSNKSTTMNAALAKKFEHHDHESTRHKMIKKPWHHIAFLFSKNPDAYEDVTQDAIIFTPGSFAVSDVPNANFFDDHHKVSFTINVTDATESFDTWFGKPPGGSLMGITAGNGVYALARLAFTGSSASCGIYTTQDGITLTPRGKTETIAIMDANGRLPVGTLRVTLEWTGGTYDVHIAVQDPNDNDGVWSAYNLCHWHDTKVGGNTILKGMGAIGWHLVGGTANATLTQFHAHPHYHYQAKRRHTHPHHPSRHHWHNMVFEVTGWTSPNATVVPHVKSSPGGLMNEKNEYLTNVDGTKIQWTVDQGPITMQLHHYLVYNANLISITDGTNTVNPKSWGTITAINHAKPTHDEVFIAGRLAAVVDAHTGKPYFEGHHHGHHQTHGSHYAKGSHGRAHQHKHHPSRFTLHNIVFQPKGSDTSPNAVGQLTLAWKAPGGTGFASHDDGTQIAIADNSTGTNFIASGSLIVLNLSATPVQFASGTIASVTSTSVFTLQSGQGAQFGTGQTATIGAQTGTIQTIAGDVITLTAALATLPVAGQSVTQSVAATSLGFLPGSTDLTQDAYVNLAKVGKIATQKDTTSLQYWTEGHHPGAHQVHAIHLAAGVGGVGVTKQNTSKYTFHDLHFSVEKSDVSPNASGQCSVRWKNGTSPSIRFVDGSASITNPGGANGQTDPLTAVPVGYYVVYDTQAATSNGWDKISAATLGTDAGQTRFLLVGQISEFKDPHTHQYELEGHHSNAHQTHGRHAASHSHGRAHTHRHHPHKKHRRKHASDGTGRHTVITAA